MVNLAQESQVLGVAVVLVAFADHGAFEHVERGEQGSGAVAFVVMGHGTGTPFFHWQPRLGAVKGLDL